MAGFDAFRYLLWLRHLGKIMYVIVLLVVGVSWWAVIASTRHDIAHGGITGLLTLLAALAFNFTVRAASAFGNMSCHYGVPNVLTGIQSCMCCL